MALVFKYQMEIYKLTNKAIADLAQLAFYCHRISKILIIINILVFLITAYNQHNYKLIVPITITKAKQFGNLT